MNNIVESKRIIYTPSEFTKENLIYLQEVGESKTLKKHTNSRNKLDSYLFFIVLDGNGILNYNNVSYTLQKGSCVFIDCNTKYSHTSDNWTIKWVHFNGKTMKEIYKKFINLNIHPNFLSKQINKYIEILDEIYLFANTNNNIKDFNIYGNIIFLITTLFNDSINLINKKDEKHIYNINSIKNYVDNNYAKSVSLDDISNMFYINKFYLIRLYKKTYGVTINKYIHDKRITKAKELLRYSNSTISEIAIECGYNDTNYFTRIFKKVEGVTPKQYKNIW